jgi:RNA polymerase sigma-70 factor (ECF subfamily)
VEPSPDHAGHTPLVRAAQAGDRDAFGELYTRFSRFVHGLLLARVGPADAADLTQDVFLRAWTRLGELRDPAAFPGWIATMAYRETLSLRLVEGLSGPEIAVLTGLTPDSVRVNLHRGFALLRDRLERRT